jgi:hypothetical protein
MDKSTILNALKDFANKRPRLDWRNYISHWNDVEGRRAYRSESRAITKDLHAARQLIRYVELSGIDAERIISASKTAFAGRLEIKTNGDIVDLNYCVGQYYPTEYRKAVCAIMASAIWAYRRDDIPEHIENKGQYLRNKFRKEFGRGIQESWFN